MKDRHGLNAKKNETFWGNTNPPGLDTLAQFSLQLAWPCPPPSPAPRVYRWLRSWWSATRCPGWWSSRKRAPSPSSPGACRWPRGGPCRTQRTYKIRSTRAGCRIHGRNVNTRNWKLTFLEFLHQRKNGAGGRMGFYWTWAYFSGIEDKAHK